jgi:hypothetical protein
MQLSKKVLQTWLALWRLSALNGIVGAGAKTGLLVGSRLLALLHLLSLRLLLLLFFLVNLRYGVL